MKVDKNELYSQMNDEQKRVADLLEAIVSDILNGVNVKERIDEIDKALSDMNNMITEAILNRTDYSWINRLKNELLLLKIQVLMQSGNLK